jgi:hypothetical protein
VYVDSHSSSFVVCFRPKLKRMTLIVVSSKVDLLQLA